MKLRSGAASSEPGGVNALVRCGDYRRLLPIVGNCALTEIRMIDWPPALLRFSIQVG